MGYDIQKFEGEIDEELLCSICSCVLEDARLVPNCEHAFCNLCIKEWVSRQQTCPVCRGPIKFSELESAPRILRNLLSRLSIHCDYTEFGCRHVIKLDQLKSHLKECNYNPKKPIPCDKGCGLIVNKDEIVNHNCIRELRKHHQMQFDRLTHVISVMRREISDLKEGLNGIRDSSALSIPEAYQRDEIQRWAACLPKARIVHWGGMISTPDVSLQEEVRKSLVDSGCPLSVIDILLENSHERRWPHGLSTLDIRQTNRRYYDTYVCRKVPRKQAVIVMHFENQHMDEEMIIDPGLVMVFANGIE